MNIEKSEEGKWNETIKIVGGVIIIIMMMMKGCETISNVFILEKKGEETTKIAFHSMFTWKREEGKRREYKTRWRGRKINNKNKSKIDEYHANF